MEKISISNQVEQQIKIKELLFVVNYFNNNINLKGFDSLKIIKMSTFDDEANELMTNQKFYVNLFYSPNKNIKVTLETLRAKNWNCSNTSHKITDTVFL